MNIWTINCGALNVLEGENGQVAFGKGAHSSVAAMAISALRIPALAVLLLTGCDKAPVAGSAAAPVQQIESPLQNTVEGMAKAKALDQERARTAQPF